MFWVNLISEYLFFDLKLYNEKLFFYLCQTEQKNDSISRKSSIGSSIVSLDSTAGLELPDTLENTEEEVSSREAESVREIERVDGGESDDFRDAEGVQSDGENVGEVEPHLADVGNSESQLDSDNSGVFENSDDTVIAENTDAGVIAENANSGLIAETEDDDMFAENTEHILIAENTEHIVSSENTDTDVVAENADDDMIAENTADNLIVEITDADVIAENAVDYDSEFDGEESFGDDDDGLGIDWETAIEYESEVRPTLQLTHFLPIIPSHDSSSKRTFI